MVIVLMWNILIRGDVIIFALNDTKLRFFLVIVIIFFDFLYLSLA